MKLGVSDSTLFSIELQLPSGGTSCLRSDTSRIGCSRPESQTVTPDKVTTNDERFSKTDLQCQIPGRSSSALSTLIMCKVDPETLSNWVLDTVASELYIAEEVPAENFLISLVRTLGYRESVLLSPAASRPISHKTVDSETLYSCPSGISKLSGKTREISTSNRGTEDEFSTSICTSIS